MSVTTTKITIYIPNKRIKKINNVINIKVELIKYY